MENRKTRRGWGGEKNRAEREEEYLPSTGVKQASATEIRSASPAVLS